MKLEAVQCPKCGAPLKLTEGARFRACDHCGVNFAVDWPHAQNPQLVQEPQLTAFEALLSQIVTQQDFLVADRRLQYLPQDIATVQKELDAAAKESVAASIALAAVRQHATRTRRRWLAFAAVLTVACPLGWFQVTRTPDSAGGWIWLAVSAVLLAGAFAGWLGWLAARRRGALLVRQARDRVREAQGRRDAAQARLKELELERELCEARTRRFRYQAT